jgi:hypothetical protein
LPPISKELTEGHPNTVEICCGTLTGVWAYLATGLSDEAEFLDLKNLLDPEK